MKTPEPSTTNLRDFLHVVFKRKYQIMLFFAATMLSVAGGTLMAKPTFEAVSQILVKIGREDFYVPPVGGSSPIIPFNREEQINSEIEILRSQALSEEVVKFFGPSKIYESLGERGWGIWRMLSDAHAQVSPVQDAVVKLQEDLVVEGIRRSNVIAVSFQHQDPQIASDVANKLIELYLDRHLEVHRYPQSFKFFEEQSAILKDKLTKAEEELKLFKTKHDLTSLAEERTLILQQESTLRSSLDQTVSQLGETENRITQIQTQMASTPKSISQAELIDHNPVLVGTLQARLVELQLEEKELLTKYTEESRFVKNIKEEIGVVSDKLAEQEGRRSGQTTFGVNPTYQLLQNELFRNEAELQALKAKKKIQTNQLTYYQKKLEELNQHEVRLGQLQQEVDVHRQNYQLYLTKSEESRISNAMDEEKIANVSLIQSARPPSKPVRPKVMLNLALGLFLGAFGGLGMAFFVEYLDDSLENPDDVEESLKLPVLASIPELRNPYEAHSN